MTIGGSVRVDSNVTWREVDGEIIALHLKTSTYFSTNKSGADLWKLLAEGTTAADMAEALTEIYGIDAGQAEADVRAFLKHLLEHDLLHQEG